jgi:hypothetical protein
MTTLAHWHWCGRLDLDISNTPPTILGGHFRADRRLLANNPLAAPAETLMQTELRSLIQSHNITSSATVPVMTSESVGNIDSSVDGTRLVQAATSNFAAASEVILPSTTLLLPVDNRTIGVDMTGFSHAVHSEMMNDRDPDTGQRFPTVLAMREAKLLDWIRISPLLEHADHIACRDYMLDARQVASCCKQLVLVCSPWVMGVHAFLVKFLTYL